MRRHSPNRSAGLPGFRLSVLAAGLATVLASGPLRAQGIEYIDTRPVRMVASIGFTGAGDKLATAYSWYRDDYSIRAGALLQLNIGAEFNIAPALTMSLTAGYHYDGVSARNGDLYFQRWPIEALIHARVTPNIRLGGGLRVPLGAQLRATGDAPDIDEDFKVPIGVVAEAEYRFGPRFGLKVRGVTERYRSKQGLPTVKGDHLGVFAAFYF